jgi:hypothetical protein
MGRDNQAKHRQLRRAAAKDAQRASYARILVVTEGTKTEPSYLEEIRSAYGLHSANVAFQPGRRGTSPLDVVDYAERLFVHGDAYRGVRPRSFDQVYAVFDRDEHANYFAALQKASALDGLLLNDERQRVRFAAIPSNPCFELWLLLHFEEVLAPMHRNDVLARLRSHVPGYEKGTRGMFKTTRASLDVATRRANAMAQSADARSDAGPFTAFHELVIRLTTLRG